MGTKKPTLVIFNELKRRNVFKVVIAYIPRHQNVKKIDVGLDITGDAKKPDIKVDTDKIKEQVMKQLKNSSPKELEDAAKKLLKQFLSRDSLNRVCFFL